MTTKITETELKELDSRIIDILKRISPEQFESIEDPIKTATKRKTAIDELRSFKERKKKLPALQKDMDERFKKVKIAKEEYKRIGKVYNKARSLFNAEAEAVTMGIERCEKTLMKTSTPESRNRLDAIKDEIKTLRETTIQPIKIINEPFPGTGYTMVTTYPEIIKKLNKLQKEMQTIIAEMINQGVE